MTLEETRREIDSVDEKLVKLLAERLSLAVSARNEKKLLQKPVEDEGREKMVIMRAQALAKQNSADPNAIATIFQEIINASRTRQIQENALSLKPKALEGNKIAFQGEHGAYGEEAIFQSFGKKQTVPCKEFHDVFNAVEKGDADAGLVPIENSTEGSINHVYDLLLNSSLTVAGEAFLRVRHCLLALEGIGFGELKKFIPTRRRLPNAGISCALTQ